MSILRDLTLRIKPHLSSDDVLIVIGARQVGKTTLLHQIEDIVSKEGHPVYFLNLEDPDYLSLLKKSPKNLLKIFPLRSAGKSYLLVDEIQYLDDPSNFLKFFYDEYKGKIKIIASGSSAFYLDKKFKDSLAGRKKIFNLFTLSFRQFIKFKGENQLAKANFQDLTLTEREQVDTFFREYLTYGGYPRVVLASLSEKEEVLRDLAYSYIKKDVLEADVRQEEVFYKLFKILASQIGSLVNTSELASTLGVSRTTIENYIHVMQKSFHLCLIRPYFTNLRKELTKMPKVYFLDLGLRNFFVKNFNPLAERKDSGPLLENALLRQLLEKRHFDEIKFWRTIQQNEVDFIVEPARAGADTRAYEVKVSPGKFSEKKYKAFLKKYPSIKLSVVSLETDVQQIASFPVLNVWQV